MCATPGICKWKPKKSMNTSVLYIGELFLSHSSPVVLCTLPQTRKGRDPVVEQSFGRHNIHIHLYNFQDVSVSEKRKERKKMKKNKENEQIDIFTFGFLDVVKG